MKLLFLFKTGRELPKECINSLEEWLDECEKLFTGIDLAKIVNMDETSIYLDFPGKYSYAKKGSRRVKATTTGNERTRISAAFTFAANGTKLPIFCVIPRVTDLNCDIPANCK